MTSKADFTPDSSTAPRTIPHPTTRCSLDLAQLERTDQSIACQAGARARALAEAAGYSRDVQDLAYHRAMCEAVEALLALQNARKPARE